MASSKNDLNSLAEQAERELNTYQAKTGNARGRDIDEAGVDTRTEKKFPGSQVNYNPDLSTNAGYNRRIPPQEGGDLDDRGRTTLGGHFEGPGGPEDKIARAQRDRGGDNDNDVVPGQASLQGQGTKERRGKDALEQGVDASRTNVGRKPPGVGGSQFKGEDYYRPEEVPDSIATEGYIPPSSVTQASTETEGY